MPVSKTYEDPAVRLPSYQDIPSEFKQSNNPYVKFISKWFFNGLTDDDLKHLVPRDGVVMDEALRWISPILRSWKPPHEHKLLAAHTF